MYTLTLCDNDFYDFDRTLIKFMNELNDICRHEWSRRSFKMSDKDRYNSDINFIVFTFTTIENRIEAIKILQKLWDDDNESCRSYEGRMKELDELSSNKN